MRLNAPSLRPAVWLTAGICFAGICFAGICIAATSLDAVAQSPDDADAVKTPAASEVEFFEKRIRPLLIERCYECHAGQERSGGLVLDHRAGWVSGGDSGPAIVPGEPETSRLVEAVRYNNLNLQMPPDGRLGADEIRLFEEWVARGAADPRTAPASVEGMTDATPADDTGGAVAATGMSLEDGRRFWSMQPLATAAIPVVSDRNWSQTAIDPFILSRLEVEGVTPAFSADRRTLIRRLSFDLIGLPPTPAEIDHFLNDPHPEAYNHLVERLLSSPHYGERWGRHWLDVVRYADSNGLDENLAFGQAWRYRDYVVRSFNEDKPFDQFLMEQVAGDLLPHASDETRTATAFLALGAKVLAEPDREKLMMDTIDEQIDTTGKAFLGMTLGCARCHDHKFDPLKQSDYYALAAIFRSTRTFADSNTGAIKHWYEHRFEMSESQRAELADFDRQIAAKNGAAAQFKGAAYAKLRSETVAAAHRYLAAASEFSNASPFSLVQSIAEKYGLHPRVLFHCRQHLHVRRDAPFEAKWHELVDADQPPEVIERTFQQLFTSAASPPKPESNANVGANEAGTSGDATGDTFGAATGEINDSPAASGGAVVGDSAEVTSPDPLLEHARAALADASGFLALPPQPQFALDASTLSEYYALLEEARLVESSAPDEASAMGVSDGPTFSSLPIHIRGSHYNLGEAVEREFPEVMRYASVPQVLPRNESGRLELAQWMSSSQHPLTARVYVNRIWQWHFGRGLVPTTENFGALGDRPSHPDLLDWLARNFIESGWSTKELHRLIVLSSTYSQASSRPDESVAQGIDPENKLLWKFPVRRLEAELIRDAVLSVAEQLDTTIGGKSVPLRNRQFVFDHTSIDHTRYESKRRALYLPVIRNNVYTLFEQFDFPDPTTPTGSRHETVVAPQALLMLNDPLVLDAAERFARRVTSSRSLEQERIDLAYELAFGRTPTELELADAAIFFQRATEAGLPPEPVPSSEPIPSSEPNQITEPSQVTGTATPSGPSAWSLFCQSLTASSEFVYVR